VNEATTNAMRLLRQAGVPFETASYEVDEDDLSGLHAALELGVEAERVFKTLVARGEKTGVNVRHSGCGGTRPQKGGGRGGRKKAGTRPCEGTFRAHGLRARRLFARWDEKKVSHIH
jgi:hypothetical protein